jgi:hypothetical protein
MATHPWFSGQSGNYFKGRRASRTYKLYKALKHDYAPQFCPEWGALHGFLAFYADLGDIPPQHFLKRVDPTKPWSKENCRWILKPKFVPHAQSNRPAGHNIMGAVILHERGTSFEEICYLTGLLPEGVRKILEKQNENRNRG